MSRDTFSKWIDSPKRADIVNVSNFFQNVHKLSKTSTEKAAGAFTWGIRGYLKIHDIGKKLQEKFNIWQMH